MGDGGMIRSGVHQTKDHERDCITRGKITGGIPMSPQTRIKTINPSGRLLVSGDIVERLSVKSRILRSVGYDDSTKILEIEFSSGYVYQYSGVPPKIYADLMHSDEIGKFFSEKVRPKFQTKQVGA
jgi:hypothetical protein